MIDMTPDRQRGFVRSTLDTIEGTGQRPKAGSAGA
jgi:hypothetical protein